jgi:diacylglycerol O-acyltransferase / wax synthase
MGGDSRDTVSALRGRRPAPGRLSVVDASFLALESPATPLLTGGLGVFEPGLSFADVHDVLRARLDEAPLARMRVQQVPFGGRPRWVDDPEFDLSFHLRHAALPAPGGSRELGELLSRLISRPLDMSRPLWEVYVIDGLEGGRVGVFRKVHLAVAGSAGADLFAVLLDDEPGTELPPPAEGRWRPEPPPGSVELAFEGVRDRVGAFVEVGNAVRHLAAAPRRLAGSFIGAAGSAVGLVGRLVKTPPDSPLNVRVGLHRRYETVLADFDDFRRVRKAFGGAINDAVVTVAADAVGRLLRSRGHDTTDLDLRVMVPVRVAPSLPGSAVEAEVLADGVVGVLAPLPVMEMDPVARLYRVMGELAAMRESRQAVAANDLVRLAGYGPATLHALAARLASAEQRYNVALSNAPGPQEPRYLRGARMMEAYPFIPLVGDAALSIAVTSYAGSVGVGLLGDWAAMPDLDLLATFVHEAIADLVEAAEDAERHS